MFYNRKKLLYEDILRQFQETNLKKSCLTGLQSSGKSFFLSDFVLRQRVLGEKSKFRILYINNNEDFGIDSVDYLWNELFYMLLSDIEIYDQGDLTELNYDDFKNFSTKKELFQALYSLKQEIDFTKFFDFLRKIKKYFQKKGIKLMIVWDQINVLFRPPPPHPNPRRMNFFWELTESSFYFEYFIFSASNSNTEMNQKYLEKYKENEINPFSLFTFREIYHLVFQELQNHLPKDVPNSLREIYDYTFRVCCLCNFSLSEYHSYKLSCWDRKKKVFLLPKMTETEISENFLESRKQEIIDSEDKFRSENIKNIFALRDYYIALRKIITFEEFLQIKDQEQKVKKKK